MFCGHKIMIPVTLFDATCVPGCPFRDIVLGSQFLLGQNGGDLDGMETRAMNIHHGSPAVNKHTCSLIPACVGSVISTNDFLGPGLLMRV